MKQITAEKIFIVLVMIYFLGTLAACAKHPEEVPEPIPVYPEEQVYLVQPKVCELGYCRNTIKEYKLCGFHFVSGQATAYIDDMSGAEAHPIANGSYVLGECKIKVLNYNMFDQVR